MSRRLLVIGTVSVLACTGCATDPSPQPLLTFPSDGAVVTGRALLSARQNEELLDSTDVMGRFEFAREGGDWKLIAELADVLDGASETVREEYTALWDVGGLEPGPARLRVGMRRPGDEWVWSPQIAVTVNAPPTAAAAAEFRAPERATAEGGVMVLFRGEESFDPDGQVVSWSWDFGDGESAEGAVVEHLYRDPLGAPFQVVLTVTDNVGFSTSGFYLVYLLPDAPFGRFEQEAPQCVCKSIRVRRAGDALGSDAVAAGVDWPSKAGQHDGKTLGGLDGNPGTGVTAGEKDYSGFAFEIQAEVEGNPDDCDEFQLVMASYVDCGVTAAYCTRVRGTYNAGTRCCSYGTTWRGTTADLDRDGDDDIEVDTQPKCEAAGGMWDPGRSECLLNFPKDSQYKPDSWRGDTTLYEAEYDYKKHVGTQVVWWDATRSSLPNGSKAEMRFLSYLRGHDARYCYARFDITYERKAGVDDESISNVTERTDQASLPGV